MSKSIAILFILGTLLSLSSAGHKRPLYPGIKDKPTPTKANTMTKNNQPVVHSCSHGFVGDSKEPVVGAGSCQSLCFFQDDQNEFCFSTTAPMLKVGWQWAQNTGTNFWRVEFQPFFDSQIFIDAKILITRLVQQTFTFDMGKFKTLIFYSLLFENSGQLCGGFGWESQAIAIKISTMFDFQDCYKTMINDLCDMKTTWEDKTAKWIDECAPSSGTGLITLKRWTVTEVLTDDALIGGTNAGGKGCWQFAEWTKWTPYLLAFSQHMFENYVYDPSTFEPVSA